MFCFFNLAASYMDLLNCFPGGSEVKESASNAGDLGSIPGSGRSPGGNPLQDSCLETPMDGGAWWATVHGVAKSRTRLSDFTQFQDSSNCWLIEHSSVYMLVKVAQSCPTLCDPRGLYSPWNSSDQNTRVGSLSLLQGIFPTQGSEPVLLYCRQILDQLSHQGSPRILEWVVYPFSRRSSWPGGLNQGLLHCRWILYQLS